MKSFKLILSSALIAAFLLAARMPNQVQMEFTFTGAEASELAAALAIPTQNSADYHFPWKKDESVCYQAGGGTAPCNPAPAPVNVLRYEAGNPPKLIFRGMWSDTTTGNGPDVPQYQMHYNFDDESELPSDWAKVWKAVGVKLAAQPNHRIVLFEHSKTLAVIERGDADTRKWLTIGFDDRSESERRTAMKQYDDCMEYHRKHPDLDSGC